MKRRAFIGAGAAAVGLLLSGCDTIEQRLTREPLPSDPLPPAGSAAHSPAVRLLNRVAYGARPGDAARVERMGLTAYVDEQLHPDAMTEDERLAWRLRPLGDVLDANIGDLFDVDDHQIVNTVRQAAILRAVYSRRQLQERMTEFWRDHFNVYAFKGQGPQYSVGFERDVLRAHAFGTFPDLLKASARSAAMLDYLDNNVNVKGAPNENYAREIMELHTLGVHAGYTQRDVQEVARCLTGWTTDTGWFRGKFRFDAARHDNGPKCVLGMTLPVGGGERDAERVLDMLAVHPATARHVATKLCVRFLGESPKPWVDHLAGIWRQTGGDIKSLLRPLLLSEDILHAPPMLKRPFDYVVSALRAWNADTDGGAGVQSHLEALGQPLYGWPMPNGFPDDAHSWAGGMIPRWNFALDLASGVLGGSSVDWDALTGAARIGKISPHDALLQMAFSCRMEDPAMQCLRAQQAAHPDLREFAALALMSPAFQWR